MRSTVLVSATELAETKNASLRLRDEIAGRGLKYHIESYGCQMNDHDSEKLAGMLHEFGYEQAESKKTADIFLFNTCCVREHAELRVFGNVGALKKLKDENPGLIVVICGCMMQQKDVAEKLYKRFPYVDLIFGTHDLHRFPVLLEGVFRGDRQFSVREMDGEITEGLPVLRGSTFSASVNIIYGCNNYCTYCIVPYVRGRERSRASESIVKEIQELADAGYKEITMLGQNVNSYAGDEGKLDFPGLLYKVNDINGIRRVRFMTSHPKDLSDGLIQAMAELPKVCKHIHLPVQSGSDAILTAMNRRYTRAEYLNLVDALKSRVPGIELTTDMIVGFPGETDADFADTLSLMKQVNYAAAYTFKYSPRRGTKASQMLDQISKEVKEQRLKALNDLQASLQKKNNQKFLGLRGEVLVEGYDNRGEPMAFGKFSNFKMVYFPRGACTVGGLYEVEVNDTQNNSLIGRLIATGEGDTHVETKSK